MTRLLLVRHGETVDNVNKIMQGQTDGMLTPQGMEQARELARQLAGEPVDVFMSSDLKRAVDTCRIIMDFFPECPFVTTPLLREREWGSFTGRYIPDLQNAPWTDDIETLDALKTRAQRFLDFLCTGYSSQTVLAVGHGIINKAIQSVYTGRPMNEIQKMLNGEVRELLLPSSTEAT